MRFDEASRLDAVRRYAILDTPPDGAFDRIAALAARTLNVPIALVSIVDEHRIWFKARHGLDVEQIGRDPGLCDSCILDDGFYLVEDAARDPRTLANPLVAGKFGLRFYAGVPLKSRDGHNLGTLCVIDSQPRTLSDSDKKTLEDLGSLVMDQMELRLEARQVVDRLATTAQEKEAALERTEALAHQAVLLSAMVQSSQDAIVTKDLTSTITSWNHAAEQIFGYTEAEMIGQSILKLIPAHRMDEEAFVMGRISRGERVEHYDTYRLRKDGSLIPISLTVSPIWDEAGVIIGASKIARDVSERKDSEQRIRLLMREVNHRVKNQFAVILSMIRQTNRTAETRQQFEARIRERIMALARSHDLLVEEEWRGSTIGELLRAQAEPFAHAERVTSEGPEIMLSPMAVQYLGMAFHELGTNAAKHGALSNHGGRIDVTWTVRQQDGDPWLNLSWRESDGPNVDALAGSGFGKVVLERVSPAAVNGTGKLDYGEHGLKWTLDAPLKSLEAEPVARDETVSAPQPANV